MSRQTGGASERQNQNCLCILLVSVVQQFSRTSPASGSAGHSKLTGSYVMVSTDASHRQAGWADIGMSFITHWLKSELLSHIFSFCVLKVANLRRCFF